MTKVNFNCEDIPLPAIVIDSGEVITEINKLFSLLTEFSEKELVGNQIQKVFPEGDLHCFNSCEYIDKKHIVPAPACLKIQTKLNGQQAVNIKVTDLDVGKLMVVYPDSVVCDNQSRYLTLAEELSNSGHWRLDVADNMMYWSKGIYHIHGVKYCHTSPTLHQAVQFLLPNERESFKLLVDKAITLGESFHFKGSIKQASGKVIKIECLGDVERDSHNKVVSVYGVTRDITKAETTFEKLKLLALVNYTISVPIFFIDENDNIVYQDISPKHGNKNSALFDYINFSCSDYLELKNQAKVKGQIKKSNISFDQFNTVFDLSVTYEAQEGIYIWIIENVTEAFKKDQQQIISNRLTILGNTFGNVSHDINNVLGVALGAIEMLEMKFANGEQNISPYIDRVKNAIGKGASVTERLLAFTKKPTIRVVSFNPDKDIEENKYLFKQVLVNTIHFDIEYSQQQCLIKFPQGEFVNILLNIVLNAQDAIQESGSSGKILLMTKIVKNKYYEVHINDSGIGIEPEDVAKIFDPFYSKKSLNKGNGIGLANVYNTMYKYNGKIKVDGHGPLGGAHFTLVFPCEVKADVPLINNPDSNIALANKRILVLDDEVSIAEFVTLFLQNQGAQVTCINTKAELIDVLSETPHFDVFITDMILPDLSGREAVTLVKEKLPGIKVYSISGYIALEERKWEYPVLRKPFTSQQLAEFLSNS